MRVLAHASSYVIKKGETLSSPLFITSHLKNTSNAPLRCCEPLQNAHILTLHVFERNLHF